MVAAPSSGPRCACRPSRSFSPATSSCPSMGPRFSSLQRRASVQGATMSSSSSSSSSSRNDDRSRADADQRPPKRTRPSDGDGDGDVAAALRLIDAHDADVVLRRRRRRRPEPDSAGKTEEVPPPLLASAAGAGDRSGLRYHGDAVPDEPEYAAARARIVEHEAALAFDARCRARATSLEQQVDGIIRRIRRRDALRVYRDAQPRRGHAAQLHRRFEGDHFLSNVDLINQTALFDVVSRMPKGAHLHIHFNACLPPNVLLDIAKGMDRMFITSNLPLAPDDGVAEHYDKCEIQFAILSLEKERPGDLFCADYQPRQTMRLSRFLDEFPRHYPRADVDVDQWLLQKLVFAEEEAHGLLQTAAGAWDKFNGKTRMMKGLFNYETAYRRYTRLCLEDFVRDNIQYAEIRPNFMTSNQLYRDDGSGPIDNWGIMDLIIDEVERFQAEMLGQDRFFGGLKVIYCTPRSMQPAEVRAALDECLRFKQKWPRWIAGFDLVGEEAKGNPIKAFVPELLAFRRDCRAAGLDVPFLFHCGETLDVGTSTDGNLVDALLLGARRIGHGFALARHPYVMQHMKARGVCLELCPISNEVLGLTPRVGGHAMYQLLANNVHCTVSSDNGAIFRSSLSHDFYQVMAGKADMGLYGWKQLVLWSLEHACLSDAERAELLPRWELLWERFLQWVVEKYGAEGGAEGGVA